MGAVLENLALVADADSVPDSEEGVVTLMTLHTAKGLEFDVVFVTGWEDGIFPHVRSMGDEKQLSEERRLAYVGITRARQRLYLTRSVSRSAWGNRMENPPSRFLDDVPDSLVDWRRLPEETEPFVERSGYGSERSAPLAASTFGSDRTGSARYGSLGGTPRKPQPKRPPLRLAAGDRVTHDKYGMGTVTEVSGSGQTAQAVIDFGSSGTVRLMLIGGVPMTKL
jgi:DNA helicase-2/ATP-dependent DNA helicase PcrA